MWSNLARSVSSALTAKNVLKRYFTFGAKFSGQKTARSSAYDTARSSPVTMRLCKVFKLQSFYLSVVQRKVNIRCRRHLFGKMDESGL
eukprot:3857303-Pleurochrysis_carterae.AAC.1